MSDKPLTIINSRKIQKPVIELLEQLLLDARNGEIQTLVCITIDNNNEGVTAWAGMRHTKLTGRLIISELEITKTELANYFVDDNDD